MEAEELFEPGRIFLVVGASNNEEKYGSRVFLDLQRAGYNVVAINRRGGEVHGTPAYESVTAFLDRVEQLFSQERREQAIRNGLLVLVVPPEASLTVLEEAAALGIRKAWFQPGSESDEALARCAELGIGEVHGQCIMVRRPRGE